MIMGHTNYERSDFRPNSTNKIAPVGHLASHPSQILQTDTFNDYLQVSYSLCI